MENETTFLLTRYSLRETTVSNKGRCIFETETKESTTGFGTTVTIKRYSFENSTAFTVWTELAKIQWTALTPVTPFKVTYNGKPTISVHKNSFEKKPFLFGAARTDILVETRPKESVTLSVLSSKKPLAKLRCQDVLHTYRWSLSVSDADMDKIDDIIVTLVLLESMGFLEKEMVFGNSGDDGSGGNDCCD